MKSPQAFLTASVTSLDGKTLDQLTYITSDFAEVYKFRKICNENNIPHMVRFKKTSVSDESYVVKPKSSIKQKISNLFHKVLR